MDKANLEKAIALANNEHLSECWTAEGSKAMITVIKATRSAPDLLVACEKALSVLCLDSDMEEDFADEITILKKAIAKARGEN